MDVDVTAVPAREPGMEPFELMTSESQERMLAIVTPADLDEVMAVCARWEVRAAVVGRVTEGGRLRILDGWEGAVLADVPAASLHEDAPCYDRPIRPPARLEESRGEHALGRLPTPAPEENGDDVLGMLLDASVVYGQYDHQLFLNTVVPPGHDAAVLRLKAPGVNATASDPLGGAGRDSGLAVSTDGNGRWCALDPRLGTAHLVAESALNVACAGAKPVAVVNCLNFGNPEHPEVMWQLSEAIDGMAEACRALSLPVIGGNVSLYNESVGRDIDPTPVVAVLGLIERLRIRPPMVALAPDQTLMLLGPRPDGAAALDGSAWAARRGHGTGSLTPVDYELHGRLLALLAELVDAALLGGVHDVADGGLALTLAEMAVRSAVGFEVAGVAGHGELFSEAPSRVVVCTPEPAAVAQRAASAGVPAVELGRAGGGRLRVEGLVDLDLATAVDAWRGRLRAGRPASAPA